MKDKKLLVLFPGAGYSNDRPLLYYARLKYEAKGYDCLKISYGDYAKKTSSRMEEFKGFVREQIKDVYFNEYSEILFVSKSLGTFIAGWLSGILPSNIKHIYLTPLKDSLQYIKGENVVAVIAGTKDEYLDTARLQEHCNRENINLKLIEGANHSLQTQGDVSENIDLLKQIVELY